MKKALLYSNKTLTSNSNESLIQQASFLRTLDYDYDFLSVYKSNRLIEDFNRKVGIESKLVNHFRDLYPVKRRYQSWKEIYDEIDVSAYSDYDCIFILGGILSHGAQMQRNLKRVNVFPMDKGQILFISVGSQLFYSLVCLKISNTFGTPIHEVLHDPQEYSLDLVHPSLKPKNHHLYFGYEIPRYNAKRIDLLQYYLNSLQNEREEKIYDFTFGYTVFTPDRENQEFSKIFDKFKMKNIFLKNKFTNEDNLLPRQDYLDLIKQSKYTLVIPSYDTTCVSIYRIMESLWCNCLPLLRDDNQLSEIESSYDVDFSPLIISDEWEEFEDDEYNKLLKYYKDKMLTFKYGFDL